jgi:hypothetical protein
MSTPIGISLREASEHLPHFSGGKSVTVETIKRWITHGYHGIKLEGQRIGKRWTTTHAALAKFTAECSAMSGVCATSSQLTRESERLRKRLLKEGICGSRR